MKKRISLLLMLICCVFVLTACGGQKELLVNPDNPDDSTKIERIEGYATNAYGMVSTFSTPDAVAEIAKCNDDELDSFFTGLNGTYFKADDNAVLVDGINSFYNARENFGDVKEEMGIGEPTSWDISEDEVIVTYQFTGSIHDGSVEIIFDKNLHITSITTNVKYTTGELMEKAGVNTLIGMGTVFVMLIIISLIISLFQFIPKIQKAFEKKETAPVADAVDNAISDIIEREEADETDDLELVAVIAAAIAASEGASSTDGFVVRSIKRIR